jgi:hypothetical protein
MSLKSSNKHTHTEIATGIFSACDSFFENVQFDKTDLKELIERPSEWVSSEYKKYEIEILKAYFENCPNDIILNISTVRAEIKNLLPNVIAEKCLFSNSDDVL